MLASWAHASAGRWKAACDAADRARAAAEATLKTDPINIYGPDSLAFAIAEQGQCRWLAGMTRRGAGWMKHSRPAATPWPWPMPTRPSA